jgi:hypothetical protein
MQRIVRDERSGSCTQSDSVSKAEDCCTCKESVSLETVLDDDDHMILYGAQELASGGPRPTTSAVLWELASK